MSAECLVNDDVPWGRSVSWQSQGWSDKWLFTPKRFPTFLQSLGALHSQGCPCLHPPEASESSFCIISGSQLAVPDPLCVSPDVKLGPFPHSPQTSPKACVCSRFLRTEWVYTAESPNTVKLSPRPSCSAKACGHSAHSITLRRSAHCRLNYFLLKTNNPPESSLSLALATPPV